MHYDFQYISTISIAESVVKRIVRESIANEVFPFGPIKNEVIAFKVNVTEVNHIIYYKVN